MKEIIPVEQQKTVSDTVFSTRVRAGKRTYFFDIKATRNAADYYVTITESKRVGEREYEKHKIFLYKEDFDKFSDALTETLHRVRSEFLEPADSTLQAPV